jgi:DNA-binding YbaB/EbfC family protein
VVLNLLNNPFQKLIESQVGAIQENLQKAMQELETATVESSVGGGVVKCTMTGSGQLLGLTIDPSVANAEDVELLEDLVTSAVRDCQARAAELKREKIMGATPLGALGVDLPEVF